MKGKSMRIQKYRLVWMLISSFNFLMAESNPYTGQIEGRVVDAETQSPLIGANVSLENTVHGAATDMDGRFVIQRVPVGSYNVRIGYIGYQPVVRADVIVKSHRTTVVNARLAPQAVETEAVTVTAGFFQSPEERPVSAIQFSNEEIRRAPGSAGDVSRILMSLPSVAKVNDQSNGLIVRGGNPIENTFFIDNIEIPNINHFPDQASSGGPIGLVQVDFIEDVRFFSGGFSPVYGDRLSSVMDISFREGNRKSFDAQLDLNFAGFGGLAEGPLGSRGSWMAAVRRSYLDLVVKTLDVGSTVAPRYGDVQGKIALTLSPKHQLTILGIFGDDHNAPDRETGIENDMIHYGSQDIYERTAGANWRAVWNKRGYSNTSLSVTSQRFHEDWYETNTGLYAIRNHADEIVCKFRNVNHFRWASSLAVEFGMEAKALRSTYDNWAAATTNATGDSIPEWSLDRSVSATKAAGFVNGILNPLPKLTATLGLRADYFSRNEEVAIAPRATLSFQLNPVTRIIGSAGLFSQTLPLLILSRHPENGSLRNPQSVHLILGMEHLLSPDTRLTLEVYQKIYSRFPADPDQPALFVLDDRYYTSGGRLEDSGSAWSRGVELMLQKKLAKDFYGLITAAFFRSRYQGPDGIWRDRNYDNRFILGVEGGYKPNRNWEFSLRWIFAGGVPYTPLDTGASTLYHRMVLDASRINETRLPDYHSLNIRFDRRFHFSRSNLIFYLSVWNGYNRKNVAMVFWNDEEQKEDVIYQWLLLPIFGLEYEF
jgi:hypothetical protein